VSNYYLTALNNGAGVIKNFSSNTLDFQYSLAWIYKFPLFGKMLRDYLGANNTLNIFLDKYGDREFNNLAGIFALYYDFGFIGACIVMIFLGIIIGLVYRLYSLNSLIGILFYPSFFIFILEILRIFYLGESRIIPIIFLSLFLLFLGKINKRGIC
jgi:hypothetical protein